MDLFLQLQMWDRNPLALGAKATKVFIEGQLMHSEDVPLQYVCCCYCCVVGCFSCWVSF